MFGTKIPTVSASASWLLGVSYLLTSLFIIFAFFLVEQVMSGNLCISSSVHPLPCYRNICPSLNKCKSFLKLGVVVLFVFAFVVVDFF